MWASIYCDSNFGDEYSNSKSLPQPPNFPDCPIVSDNYQAVLDYGALQGYRLPTNGEVLANSQFLECLDSIGVLASRDVFYLYKGGGDSNFAALNVIDPALFASVKLNAPTYIEGIGFEGDGVAASLNTQYNPSIDTGNFVSDFNSTMGYEVTSFGENSSGSFGTDNSGGVNMFPRNASDVYTARQQGFLSITGASLDASGFWHLDRSNGADFNVNKNGVATFGVAASEPIANSVLYVLRSSTNFGNRISALFGLGSSIQSLVVPLNDCVQAYVNPYDADYQKVIDYGILQGYRLPTTEELIANSAFIECLKSIGAYALTDVYYLYKGGGDSDFAALNIIDPTLFASIKVNAPIYLEGVGFQGNFIDAQLDNQYNPSVELGGNMVNNNCSIQYYEVTDLESDGNISYGTNGTHIALVSKNSTGTFNARLQAAASFAAASVSSKGFWHTDRIAGNEFNVNYNGVASLSPINSSIPFINSPIYIFRFNTAYGDKISAVFGLGASMQSIAGILNNCVQQYVNP